jgi:UDP-N-acetylglucosamine:LPS N-acetylglucosamine transferase
VLLLVCSSGGHLTQLYNLRPWWERFERTWVTFHKPDATSLLSGERALWAYHPTTRNLWNLLRNTALAWRTVRRVRPDLIVSTGAAVAFPFFLVGKLFGAKTIYVEVFDRLDSATLTGRLCYPISDRFLLQWEEQRAIYPKGEVVGPLL